MELKVNTNTNPWRYTYTANKEYENKDWMDMEVDCEDADLARWQLLNKECKGLLKMQAVQIGSEYTTEEVIQESYLAYNDTKSIIGHVPRASYMTRYLGALRDQLVGTNQYNARLHSNERYDLYEQYAETMRFFAKLADKEHREEFEMDPRDKEKLMQRYVTKREYDLLIDHFELGRALPEEQDDKSPQAYSAYIRRLMGKIRRGVERSNK